MFQKAGPFKENIYDPVNNYICVEETQVSVSNKKLMPTIPH